MALARSSSPWDILPVRDDLNRVLNLFNEMVGRFSGLEGAGLMGTWTPAVDLYETEDAFVLKAELPGFAKDEVSVDLHDNTLTLRGERKREAEVKEEQYHRMERAYGTFQRSFVLPAPVDHDKARASYKDGVLELQLPKTAAAKPRRIAISG